MPGPVLPRSMGNPLTQAMRMLGVQLPPPEPAATRQPWQDMPGSQPRPTMDALMAGLVDVPKGFLLGPDLGEIASRPVQNGRRPWKAQDIGSVLSLLAPVLGKIVYHGSPHVFRPEPGAPLGKFKASAIGTGEGAQAYGHGVPYLADSPSVAGRYRDPHGSVDWTIGDVKVPNWIGQSVQRGYSIDEMIQDFQARIADNLLQLKGSPSQPWMIESSIASQREILRALELAKQGAKASPGGALYTVDLPDEQIAKMIDWDAPLSQQSDEVIAALNGITGKRAHSMRMPDTPDPEWGDIGRELSGQWRTYDPTGQQAYESVASLLWAQGTGKGNAARQAPALASEALRQRGVPGIRYFDGLSRGQGQGTYNYVMFDPDIPKIVGMER